MLKHMYVHILKCWGPLSLKVCETKEIPITGKRWKQSRCRAERCQGILLFVSPLSMQHQALYKSKHVTSIDQNFLTTQILRYPFPFYLFSSLFPPGHISFYLLYTLDIPELGMACRCTSSSCGDEFWERTGRMKKFSTLQIPCPKKKHRNFEV